MLLSQLEYFQAVVREQSFTEAAEVCHISQSAVSQQIKSLEKELGVQLLARHNRTFSLTPAGKVFYEKSAVVLADLEELKRATIRAGKGEARLALGSLASYAGGEFLAAVADFAAQYPKVQLSVTAGTHEELYQKMKRGELDLVLNDQRRAFSSEYVNLLLTDRLSFVLVAAKSPLAALAAVDVTALKNTPCILVASAGEEAAEREYYRDIIGFKGEILFAPDLSAARLLVAAGRGVLPVDGSGGTYFDASTKLLPLLRDGARLTRRYCAFYRQDNAGYYVETFAEILREKFA